jgi:hypothetical protein
MRRCSALLVALAVAGCGAAHSRTATTPASRVEQVNGTKQVVLSAQAANRLGIQTSPVRAAGRLTVVPYAAVLYAADGRASTYTNPARLTYVRQPIRIDHISGSQVYLAQGPPAGTAVVTVGEDELLGAENGVAGESH